MAFVIYGCVHDQQGKEHCFLPGYSIIGQQGYFGTGEKNGSHGNGYPRCVVAQAQDFQ